MLPAYLRRIGLSSPPKADLPSLSRLMAAHSATIPFENCDVVLRRPISMEIADVVRKLVDGGRGGYCFEQNTLLRQVLEEVGFHVTPLLCRVRWGKPDDADGPNTTFTHMALKVKLEAGEFLVDVGFAGINSIAPVALGVDAPQSLPEGEFRVVAGRPGYDVLQLLVKGEWRSLYTWQDVPAPLVDQECSNWYSCTFPKARFTTSFFVCRVIGDERHHILNDVYATRKGHGFDAVVESTQIRDKAHLLELLDSVFGLSFPADTVGLDRYLAPN
ncbi:hypothetical protein AB1Y20_019858 [Prymnesium parvum]|uniref:Arylamine N-acetyltransferase n=1 Tax=Prymnesium parvum TaxID=97485 RepID=A0AB34JVN4_PRYPA